MNDQMMRLAKEAGFLDGDLELFPETIERFAELVRQDEREACAKLLNDFAKTSMVPVVDSFQSGLKAGAYAILSRGEK